MKDGLHNDHMLDVLERLDKDEMFKESALRSANHLLGNASTNTRMSVLQDALEHYPVIGMSVDDVRVMRENVSKGYLTLFKQCLMEQDPENSLMQIGLMFFTGYLFHEQFEYDTTREYEDTSHDDQG